MNSSSAQSDRDENATNSKSNTVVVANHYNDIKEIGLERRAESKIFYMRNFNNWIKSQLIQEYARKCTLQCALKKCDFKVLDLCCGKGGDLLKWQKASINYLVCTDIAEVSIQQCQSRYEDMKQRNKSRFFKESGAEFIICDATKERLKDHYKEPTMEFSLVSCQFALHYSFESYEQADCMLRNAAENLLQGGYFIATLPDANEIMKRLRAPPKENRRVGNKLYFIEFECDTEPPPIFGARYNFHLEEVVNCPEFLVHFPTLVKLCKRHGLELERKTTFFDYFQERNDRAGQDLLRRMKALQEINEESKFTSGNEYEHVLSNDKKVSKNNTATLSKSEWEATSIYMVCAFKKV